MNKQAGRGPGQWAQTGIRQNAVVFEKQMDDIGRGVCLYI